MEWKSEEYTKFQQIVEDIPSEFSVNIMNLK